MDTLKLIPKDIYGKTLFYPDCPVSFGICEATGRKSLTLKQVERLREAGFKFSLSRPLDNLFKESELDHEKQN